MRGTIVSNHEMAILSSDKSEGNVNDNFINMISEDLVQNKIFMF